MIRLLVFTTLYPNAAQPHHGIFVEQRLRHLVATGEVEASVVAPVPWFPWTHPRFGRYGLLASVPRFERRHGIDVWHPRYPVVPKVGMNAAPALLASTLWPVLRRLHRQQDFDVIDAHYFYPDGVTAVWLGQRLRKPVVVTARGSDINVIAGYSWPRRAIRWAARNAEQVITVSNSLKTALVHIGVPEAKVSALPNGVDLSVFAPGDQGALSRDFGFAGPVLLSVGHLVEGKGHHIAIDALAKLPAFNLVIVGRGPEENSLRQLITAQNLQGRVIFTGPIPHECLAEYYRAADALILATRSEGMPNVVLEALACGTPVVATAVGGIPDVLKAPEAGRMVTQRTADAFASAVQELFDHYPDRSQTRRYAEQFSWAATTRGQLSVFRQTSQARATAYRQVARR